MRSFFNLFLVFSVLGFSSCVNKNAEKLTSQLIYFKGDPKKLSANPNEGYEPIIQKGDNLLIIVNSFDENQDKVINLPSTLTSSSVSGSVNSGYLVDLDGNIQVPLVGTVRAAGLSKSQLQSKLIEELKSDKVGMKDPVINIRYLNYKINVLGEVTKPGQYLVGNDKPTLFDAIGMAGDLTTFGRRDTVYIYREFNGKRELGIVNLNSIEVFNSPYFYLRQNDLIYVLPSTRKMLNVDQSSQRNIGFATSIISTLAFLVTTIATVSKF